MSTKFHSNDTSLRNMTHNTSIQNQNFSILCLILAEISMRFHSKNNSLRNKTHNTSIQDQNFTNLFLLLPEIEYEISFK